MRRGFTLIEIVIASAISLLIMTAVAQLFVSGGRIFARGQTRADLQASGLVGLNRLVGELRRTSLDTLTVTATPTSTPKAVAFRIEDLHVGQPALFAPSSVFVLYYLDADKHAMIRKTWPSGNDVTINPDPIVNNRRLSAAEIALICTHPNGTEHAAAACVGDLTVSPQSFPGITPVGTVQITLSLQQEVSSSEILKSTVTDAVYVRNHR